MLLPASCAALAVVASHPLMQLFQKDKEGEGLGRAALRAVPPQALPRRQSSPGPTAEPASWTARWPILLVLPRCPAAPVSLAPPSISRQRRLWRGLRL